MSLLRWSPLHDSWDAVGKTETALTVPSATAISRLLGEGSLAKLDASVVELQALLQVVLEHLGWRTGTREVLVDVIAEAVLLAEAFGPGQGAKKREFVLDVVMQVIEDYDPDYELPSAAKALVRPFVGILVDWTVAAFDIHDAWEPVGTVRVPLSTWRLVRRVLVVLSAISRPFRWLASLFRQLDPWKRAVRHTATKLTAEVQRLRHGAPPESLPQLTESLGTLIARFGQLTIPHVKVFGDAIEQARSFFSDDPRRQEDLAVEVSQAFLVEAYAHHPMLAELSRSRLGTALLREGVLGLLRILRRRGVLPP